ncbi:hypothetical protein ONZ43_g657 [Nemania bipapillata]|uniref:Uncharacterized protein n=1 Tax=Nemania bipapillata TaxID=110536 RepID=A0ACC2J798_9PEZI|nr:hypothetical protein ONZ43_g657 [Nemania bipapillata]
MDESPGREQPTSDISDFSDDEALQPEIQSQRSRHGSIFSTIGSSDLAHMAAVDRNDYSDEDIRIIYEIVVRAETILAEELTPSSRLPTHALFLAYDEILAEYGLDPNERHISKLVFMVGGVKGQKSLLDKFKAVMARMHITLAIEEPQGSEGEHEYRESHPVANDAEAPHMANTEPVPSADTGRVETHEYKSGSDYAANLSIEPISATRERFLADKAAAFRKRHHAQFLAVATLRRWQNKTHQANYLGAQSDAMREAEMIETLEEKFNIWRGKSAEATQAAPNKIPPNAYSKRTERIAIRAHEILSTKRALEGWRQSNWDEYCKNRNAQLVAEQVAAQDPVTGFYYMVKQS